MTSLNQRKPIGGTGSHRVVCSVTDLAALGCGAAGPCGELSKCPKSFRVGTLNVGTMKGKASEVSESRVERTSSRKTCQKAQPSVEENGL